MDNGFKEFMKFLAPFAPKPERVAVYDELVRINNTTDNMIARLEDVRNDLEKSLRILKQSAKLPK